MHFVRLEEEISRAYCDGGLTHMSAFKGLTRMYMYYEERLIIVSRPDGELLITDIMRASLP